MQVTNFRLVALLGQEIHPRACAILAQNRLYSPVHNIICSVSVSIITNGALRAIVFGPIKCTLFYETAAGIALLDFFKILICFAIPYFLAPWTGLPHSNHDLCRF